MWWIKHDYVLTPQNVEKMQPLLALLYTHSEEGISVPNTDAIVSLVKGNMSADNPASLSSVKLSFREVPWSGTMILLPTLSQDLLNSIAKSGSVIPSFDTWIQSAKSRFEDIIDTLDHGYDVMIGRIDVPGLTYDNLLPTFARLALEIGVTRAYHVKIDGTVFFGIPSKKRPEHVHPIMMTCKNGAAPYIGPRDSAFPAFDCDDGFVDASAFGTPSGRDLTQWNNDWEEWKKNWDVRAPILKWSM